MEGNTLSLVRNDFVVHSRETFNSLFEDTNFTDVTLACTDQQQISVHKIILSAGSNFFKNLLIQNPHPHPLIYLKINYMVLHSIVKFIYFGECEVEHSQIDHFLSVATDLQIDGLLSDVHKDEKKHDSIEDVSAENIISVSDENNIGTEQEIQSDNSENVVTTGNSGTLETLLQKDDTVIGTEQENQPENVEYAEKLIEEGSSQNSSIKTEPDVMDDNEHNNQNISRETEYNCKQCAYVGRAACYLKRHVETVHDGMTYKCDFCEYQVADKN